MRHHILITAAFLAIPFAASATDIQANHIARIEANLEPLRQAQGHAVTAHTLREEMLAHHTPAISIAVVDNGKIIWAKAYVMADVASGKPATTRTLFQAASISKPVAASAAMQLVQEGLLSLDSPANSQLLSWHVPDNRFTKDHPVTLRQLLSHSGGVTVDGFPGYPAGTPVPNVIEVLDGRLPANTKPVVVDMQPGTEFRYSGGGFTIVQLMMTDATKIAFPDLMRERVLEPMAMADSTYEQPLPMERKASAATGYLANGAAVEGHFHIYPEMAAAGLWTTPSDLARWAIGLEDAYDGTSSILMSQSSAEQMLTAGLGNRGLDLRIGGTGQDFYFFHAGDNWGFKANLIAWPKGKRAIIAMANGDDGMAVVLELMQSVAREYGWNGPEPLSVYPAALTKTRTDQAQGSFGRDNVVISPAVSRLFLTTGPPAELLAIGTEAFIAAPRDQNVLVHLGPGADGPSDRLSAIGEVLPSDR